MDITPLISKEKKNIKAYGNGGFVVNDDEIFDSSIIIFPTFVNKWPANSVEDIELSAFHPIIENKNSIDLLLIGCGTTHMPLTASLHSHFSAHHIGIDMMTTGAACRTYNVLLSEGRNVAAALIAV